MSDFLSNFVNNDDDENKGKKEIKEESPEADESAKNVKRRETRANKKIEPEHVEFDPTYKKRRQKKIIFISLASIIVLLGLFTAYYQFTRVKVPDFKRKEISKAREWSTEEGVLLKINNKYSFSAATNQIIKQSVASGEKIKKGRTLNLTVSLGPDPEAQVFLPEFSKMTSKQAKDWVKREKAENVSVIEQYDEKVQKGAFMKQEAANKELNLKNYKRKDRLSVYYSKGKETFEKNIEVPDFTNKSITEVNEWVRKNEVKLVTEKVFSQSIALDSVVSQQTSIGTKIAKQDELKLQLSKGKPLVVPDYGKYTLEEARELSGKLTAVLKSAYSETVPFGHFISQNVAAGTELDEKDNPPTIEVVYSEGRPYIKDLRKNALEGDLPKLFFETYSAKGATITYDVFYVDSSEPKGTVVEMSRYGEYLPMIANLSIGISLGNIESKEEAPANTPVGDETADSSDPSEGGEGKESTERAPDQQD
ncbi:PASTA domain-containing protein [Enterococcus sp.]|uniref:PASTA domain-containing protein n=1 Tax=Enterococcus sp. TaxID=35783 RepID=UPI00290BA174|nr:PASTA domain-containing protein [Enterococcus sp.]MDU5336393.1 PASTA domain-containing protein [Enterococcus sp.]